MNKLNLPPFYIGQKVEYITGIKMPKGSIHIVSDIFQSICGCYSININGNKVKTGPFNPLATIWHCEDCNKKGDIHRGDKHKIIDGWDPNSFRAIEEAKYPLMSFTQIKEVEKEEILLPN